MNEMKYVFPYHLCRRGDRIAIIGESPMANEFHNQLMETGYATISNVVCLDGVENILLQLEYDIIILAVEKQGDAIKIKDRLVSLGIQPEIIRWDGHSYKWSGFLQDIYLNILNASDFLQPKSNDLLCGRMIKRGCCPRLVDYIGGYRQESLSEVIDIMVPIYNAYEYTKSCIESILKNTTTPYNLYLVNDCSTDERIHGLLVKVNRQEKPRNLRNLTIIEHSENMGFQRTVNDVVTATSNHLVLVNSDTEVPREWLERLMYPIIHDGKVASVTPTTNASSQCSFPNYGGDNRLIYNSTIEEVDEMFGCLAACNNIDIVVGTGFCMALNRQALNEMGPFDSAFEKGYGEETDWCLRAEAKGWRNVWAVNVFVYHKHGASFGTKSGTDREAIMKKARELVDERHPMFMSRLEAYWKRAPWRRLYDWVQCLLYLRKFPDESKDVSIRSNWGKTGANDRLVLQKIPENRMAFRFFVEHEWHEFIFSLVNLQPENIRRLFSITGINTVKVDSDIIETKNNIERIYAMLSH